MVRSLLSKADERPGTGRRCHGLLDAPECRQSLLCALAKYIQKRLGNIYPHLPLAPAAPSGVEFPLVYPGVFTIYPNGTGDLDPMTNVTGPATWSLNEGVCAAFDDVDTATEFAARMHGD